MKTTDSSGLGFSHFFGHQLPKLCFHYVDFRCSNWSCHEAYHEALQSTQPFLRYFEMRLFATTKNTFRPHNFDSCFVIPHSQGIILRKTTPQLHTTTFLSTIAQLNSNKNNNTHYEHQQLPLNSYSEVGPHHMLGSERTLSDASHTDNFQLLLSSLSLSIVFKPRTCSGAHTNNHIHTHTRSIINHLLSLDQR